MRQLLNDTEDLNVITYGCSAHLLNLFAHDIEIPSVKELVLKVVKYFRNKHLPSAWYKEANGKKLVMPQEVRWNTVSDCLRSYLDNRGILIPICQDRGSQIDDEICALVSDVDLTRQVADFLLRIKPVSIALDRVQRDNTNISIAVEVWFRLEKDLEGQPLSVLKEFEKRMKMALGPEHFLANIADHRFRGERLSDSQKDEAFKYLHDI